MDTHELGELLDTGDSSQQRHERWAGATADIDNRMQAGGDDAGEGQPVDATIRYTAAQVPRMVETHTSVCAAMLKGTPGKTLRRILERYKVQLKTADVFWGWVAQESTEGWLQLSGSRPQRGKGKSLMEWRVQAAEAGGWGSMLASGTQRGLRRSG